MYILKNAFRNIVRSKGRNILIGIIIFIISASLCIGLSIRQAASNARETTLDGLTITAQISVDRNAMMEKAMGEKMDEDGEPREKNFDRSSFKGFSESLSIEELTTYASASTVDDFYYTITSSLNGTDDFEPVSDSVTSDDNESETSNDSTQTENLPQNGQTPDPMGDRGGMMGGGKNNLMLGNGDFSIIGYSSDTAMTDFINGTSTITDGVVFEEGTSDYDCIISSELATYNSISVDDKIVLSNPNDEEEIYELTVVGIYETTESTESKGMSQMFSFADPSNEIYMSYNTLKSIVDNSESVATTTTDDNGYENSTKVFSQSSGTYTFKTVEDYEKFTEEVYELGLSEDYAVTSTDLSRYEQSLVPLETLSTIAGYFLIVIIAIGALILIVLNIFSIRERKYEIGVLTAIGMKKSKVALQFISEMLIVTLIGVIIGGAVGAVSAVPVADIMLENQIVAQQQTQQNQMNAFGRQPGGIGDFGGGNTNTPPEIPDNSHNDQNIGSAPNQNNYISEITAAVDITVLLQLLGICVLLALLASAVSVTAIMRYDPLRILSNRD